MEGSRREVPTKSPARATDGGWVKFTSAEASARLRCRKLDKVLAEIGISTAGTYSRQRRFSSASNVVTLPGGSTLVLQQRPWKMRCSC